MVCSGQLTICRAKGQCEEPGVPNGINCDPAFLQNGTPCNDDDANAVDDICVDGVCKGVCGVESCTLPIE